MMRILSKNIKTSQFREDFAGDDVFSDDPNDRYVNENNYADFLADDLDNEDQEINVNDDLRPPVEDYQSEIPSANEILGIPADTPELVYDDPEQLITDSIANREIISFEYTNRHGNYSGLRTVEPHYSFIAMSTGNEILVSFDRDVDDIRAFIIGNIHSNGVRYKGIKFAPKAEIMRGIV